MKPTLMIVAAGALLAAFGATSAARAQQVAAGSDYLETQTGTFFILGGQTIDMIGNPIGPGLTDTIIQRPNNITIGSSGALDLTALSLKSAAPVSIGSYTGEIYVTQDATTASTGTIAIMGTLAGGTFNSSLDVFFDVCSSPGAHGVGCAAPGDLLTSGNLMLSQSGATWSPTPPPGTVLVYGPYGDVAANLHSGLPSDVVDFFPGTITEMHPNGAQHIVMPASPGPLPGAGLPSLILMLLAGVASRAWASRQG